MSHLDDDQIRASLGRRSGAGLTEVERANILRAARLRALAPRRRLLPRFAGWLAATAAVAVLVVIAVPVLLSSPVPVARASSPGATQTSASVLHISNETALQLTVLINGRVAEKAAPNSESIVDPTPYSEPWHVTVTTDSGRQLVQLTYGASDVWYTSNSAHGVAQRVDLSCGRLDVYAGPPLLGPAPPSSFPPHDCDEALPTISTNPTQPPQSPTASSAAPSSTIGAVPQVYVSNGTTLKLAVAINGESRGTSEPGTTDLFDPSGLAEPWNVTLTTSSGRQILEMTYRLSDIGTSAGGTNPEPGMGVGQRLDLSCGRLDVYVGGPILGGTALPIFSPGDCDP